MFRKFITLMIIGFSSSVIAQVTTFSSEYSSIKDEDCKTANRGADYLYSCCPPHNNYVVCIDAAEAMSNLVIIKKGKPPKDINTDHGGVNFGSAPAPTTPYVAGDKLEWRYQTTAGKKTLVGLIYRVGDQSSNANSNVLFVVRATDKTFCSLGFAKTNAEARELVDSNKQCQPAP